jgi:hypothetical protein
LKVSNVADSSILKKIENFESLNPIADIITGTQNQAPSNANVSVSKYEETEVAKKLNSARMGSTLLSKTKKLSSKRIDKYESLRVKFAKGEIYDFKNDSGTGSVAGKVTYINSKKQRVEIKETAFSFDSLGGYKKAIYDANGKKLASKSSRFVGNFYSKTQIIKLAENIFDTLYITNFKINQILSGHSKHIA